MTQYLDASAYQRKDMDYNSDRTPAEAEEDVPDLEYQPLSLENVALE
jgi:hypothetical protein